MAKPAKILIVGGGTAGWMTACLFAKKWAHQGIDISLIESQDVPTVGVGEGSTPYIRKLFSQLGLSESDWMPYCEATYKNGIRFTQWTDKPGYTQYFHPFVLREDHQQFNVFRQHVEQRRKGVDVPAHPDDFFVMTQLTENNKLAFKNNKPATDAFYAYHFDAGRLGELLKEHAKRMGVNHITGHISKVEVHLNYDIAAVHTDKGVRIGADFFVDCSGFKGLLINKTLECPFISYGEYLLNDSAVAIPSASNNHLKAQTLSEAMSCGWRWEIPLIHRTGNGYVYSSHHLSKENAQEELRKRIGQSISEDNAKHLRMRVGRNQYHWQQNCLAVGLSQGFIEPLEATALQLVQVTIEQFIAQFERGNFTEKYQQYFNDGVNHAFDHIRDYVQLHYLANTRNDSRYWQDSRRNVKISDSLQWVLETWSQGGDLTAELQRQNIEQYYSTFSWHIILAGMGVFPPKQTGLSHANSALTHQLNQIKQAVSEQVSGFSSSAIR